MSYTYKRINKLLKADMNNVQGSGACDTTGFMCNYPDLKQQMECNSSGYYWTKYLVHPDFLDEPQQGFLKPKICGDPKPIKNPRPGNYEIMSS